GERRGRTECERSARDPVKKPSEGRGCAPRMSTEFFEPFCVGRVIYFPIPPSAPRWGVFRLRRPMQDAASTMRETQAPLELLDHLVAEVEKVFHGKREVVRLAVSALLARGHLLFEDVPGVGKTTLAHALARVLGLGFRRI